MLLVSLHATERRTNGSVGFKHLGYLEVVNIGGDENVASYKVRPPNGRWVIVSGFDRNRGAWALVGEALDALDGSGAVLGGASPEPGGSS